jgi:hypothetical protein
VSLLARRYSVYVGTQQTFQSGVSAATPVVAAMLAIVNSHRLAMGRPLLGYINPYLYQNYSLFANDITSGNNKCAEETSSVCCTQGFSAATGWDPVTGLGSVDFVDFYNLILNHGFAYTPRPTASPTVRPTRMPTAPTAKPTPRPSVSPTTATPSVEPSLKPTSAPPTVAPSKSVSSTSSSQPLIIGAVVGGVVLLALVIGGAAYYNAEAKPGSEDGSSRSGSEYGDDDQHTSRRKGRHAVRTDNDSDGFNYVPTGSEDGDAAAMHEHLDGGILDHMVHDIADMFSSFLPGNHHNSHPHHHHQHSPGRHGSVDDLNSAFFDSSLHSENSAGQFDDFMPDVKEFELSAGLSEQLQYTFSADNCELKPSNKFYSGSGKAAGAVGSEYKISSSYAEGHSLSISSSFEDGLHVDNDPIVNALQCLSTRSSSSGSGSSSSSSSGSGSDSDSDGERQRGNGREGGEEDDDDEDYGEVVNTNTVANSRR